MTVISSQMVKQLREMTGAGMMDCKKALEASQGNFDDAVAHLRKAGLKNVEKRAGKVASDGLIFSYIHPGARVGVIMELNCETDFVARGADFQGLAKTIAMHIAWSKPQYVCREEIAADVLQREKDIYLSQLKPGQEKVAEKIVSGKLEKYYEEACLLEQFDARDPASKKRIGDLVTELSAKVGEKIVVRRFVRFELGEGIEKPQSDFAAEVAAACA